MDRTAPPLALPRSLALLMLVSAVPLVGHIPWWILLCVAVLVLWRLSGIQWLPLPGRGVRWLVALVASGVFFLRFHTFIGERQGIAFFMLLYGLKLLETAGRRDLIVLALLSYIGLFGGILYDPGIGMGLFSAAFLVLSFAVLGRIVAPQLPGRTRWRMAALLLAQAIPLAALLYLLFPRVAGGFFGHKNVAVGQTGISRILRPGSLSDLAQSRKVAFRVLFRGPRPAPSERYFRVYVLSHTNGHIWWAGSGWRPGVTRGHPRMRYTVLLNADGRRALPALDWPVAAPASGRMAGGATLFAARPVEHMIRYRLVSAPVRAATLSPRLRTTELALPDGTAPRLLALGRRLAAGTHNADVIAHRALHYFVAHHFVYTLTPPPMGQRPMARFLFTIRAGYCEDYAAAFAMLLRAAGVPTRIVVGYVGGQYNPDGNDVIVRAQDAHAWDECWIRGRWVRFDPTAVVAPGTVRYGLDGLVGAAERGKMATGGGLTTGLWRTFARFVMDWRDAAVTGWDNWVVSYDWQRQEALLAHLGWSKPDRMSLALLVLGLLAAAAYGVRVYGTRPKRTADPALALYRRYQARLGRIGLVARADEGPLAFAARVVRSRPDLAPAVHTITETYVATRYGGIRSQLPVLRRAVWRFLPRPPKT